MAEVIRLLESRGPSRRTVLAAGAVGVLAASVGIVAYVRPWRRDEQPPAKPDPPGFSPEQLAASAELGVPVEWTDDYGISFVLIPKGHTWVGTPAEEIDRLVEGEGDPDYHPSLRAEARRVFEFKNPVYLARTELTVGQMRAVVGARRRFITEVEGGTQWGYAVRNGEWMTEPGRSWEDAGPEFPLTDAHPAINLTWYDATKLALMMSHAKGGSRYLLPDEDLWEYACLAGLPPTAVGGEAVPLADVAVFDQPVPRPVGTRLPNPWGLSDMLGNLLEWCHASPKGVKPEGAGAAPLRGGKFNDPASRVRAAARVWKPKWTPMGGLRLAMVAVPAEGKGRALGK
jgi:formylglycine-generating enzyme required for sulfatase activity